ncbi:hypothetical protein [Chryseobacterium sp. PCH239]|nr:hypothetical protein [Chryseobacterium sp. PCH239]
MIIEEEEEEEEEVDGVMGKRVLLHIKRRGWIDKTTGESINNESL